MQNMDTASQATSAIKDGTGIRKTLRIWKEKWRSNRTSSPRAPLSRLPSKASSAKGAHKSTAAVPVRLPLPPIPASPPPVPTALFTATTETFIHSPADPRNRSRNTSASSSAGGTLRRGQPMSRRNTAPSEFLANTSFRDGQALPMNVVTTTIMAGNDSTKRKRTSRLRLSISRRGSILASSPSSPSLNSYFERSSSRATSRFEPVPEMQSRKRASSDGATVVEEVELIKRDRPKVLGREEDEASVQLAYQYVGSRDGKRD